MSIRRKVGDIVKKKENAGFVGKSLVVRIVDLDPERPETNHIYADWCIYNCGDDHCREWANCEIVVDEKPTDDYCYHVSECQMEDL